MAKFLPLLAFLTSLLLLLKATSALNFNYPNFFSAAFTRYLIFQGDAVARNGQLQLTQVDSNGNPLGNRVGRVLHTTPILFKDSFGAQVGFTTTFVFRITRPGSVIPADGLTFFIAPPDSTIPPGSNGGLLGLFPSVDAHNNVVAVEFDTHVNPGFGDPNFRHIGVDVNTIRSRVTRRWDWVNGELCTATITYNPSSGGVLRVVAAYPNRPSVVLSYNVNLGAFLPATVRVGFSASTGSYSQVNNILAWSFSTNSRGSHVAEEDEGGYIASVV